MEFDQNSTVVQLCAKGMELEGQGQPAAASRLFLQAWQIAANDFEKCTAAHYVARHQTSVAGKLRWDKTALQHALNIQDNTAKAILPSLYLNIGKCYEDVQDIVNAKKHYELAWSAASFLPSDGYGNMIKQGIRNGLERVQ